MFPRFIGNILVNDITKGRYTEIKRIVLGVRLIAYLHRLKIRIDEKEFIAPVAIADSGDVEVSISMHFPQSSGLLL